MVNPSAYFSDSGRPFIHGSDIRDGEILTGRKLISASHSDSLWRSRLDPGDVLVVRAGYPGRAAAVPEELAGANCASVLILKRGHTLQPEYLSNYMNSEVARLQVSLAQYGAAQEQINVGDIVNFVVPVPPREEQQAIVAALAEQEAERALVTERIVRHLGLLEERRRALITAAVTGELEVAGVAA